MAELTHTEASRIRSAPEGAASEPTGPAEHTAPLGGLREARLTFRSGAQELRLRSGKPTADLYRARFDGAAPQVRVRDGRVLVQYRGLPLDFRKRLATMLLNPTIPWTIEIVGGVLRVAADLHEVRLSRFDMTGRTDRIELELGAPSGEVPIRLIGGAKTVLVGRPAAIPVGLNLEGGAGRIEFDGRHVRATAGVAAFESEGWQSASDRYRIEIIGGAKSIEVIGR